MSGSVGDWRSSLDGDPLPWLLDPAVPAVRHRALIELLDLPLDDVAVVEAGRAAMMTDPIATILARQDAEGWWVKPGVGYSPKYTGTVWTLIFLDQLGADGADPRIARGCEYVLRHAQAPSGGFGFSGGSRTPPPPSSVAHCLNGNLLRALIGFGRLDDERVQRALAWEATAISGEGHGRWYAITPGAGFRCGVNEDRPCAWGAVKAVLALARVPAARRTGPVAAALAQGVDFLLSVDPSTAAYPMGWGDTRPNASWFKLGFPSGYVADVLQVMEAVCEAGGGGDPRLDGAASWLLAQQEPGGRWRNRYPYRGKMHVDIDPPGIPSRWVTLRACRVLKAIAAGRSTTTAGSAAT